jgi:NAD(P)-dependent dehydrogenase (short-subunit alcohol dehydrogenase family)
MNLGLNGKVALITGGSEGIGRATALCLAREGAIVSVCARRAEPLAAVEKELLATGATVFAFQGDATNAEQMQQWVKQVHDKFGKIDILVNNAGGSGQLSFDEIDEARWQEDVTVKLFAPMRLIRLVLPYMKAQKSGSIINLTMAAAATPGGAPGSRPMAAVAIVGSLHPSRAARAAARTRSSPGAAATASNTGSAAGASVSPRIARSASRSSGLALARPTTESASATVAPSANRSRRAREPPPARLIAARSSAGTAASDRPANACSHPSRRRARCIASGAASTSPAAAS